MILEIFIAIAEKDLFIESCFDKRLKHWLKDTFAVRCPAILLLEARERAFLQRENINPEFKIRWLLPLGTQSNQILAVYATAIRADVDQVD